MEEPRAIRVNPDSPQRPLRAEVLRRGTTVFVPTSRLRGGFKRLDPSCIPPDRIDEAASLSHGVNRPSAAPTGIDWTRLSAEYLEEMPILAELKRMTTSNA